MISIIKEIMISIGIKKTLQTKKANKRLNVRKGILDVHLMILKVKQK